MKEFALITEIIPISHNNERITKILILPKLISLPSFRKFYELQFSIIKKDFPQLARLDFYSILMDSPYLS